MSLYSVYSKVHETSVEAHDELYETLDKVKCFSSPHESLGLDFGFLIGLRKRTYLWTK